jgi:arylsulfatase A
MTGKYNYRNYEYFGYLNPNQKTFGNLLKEAGYETAIVGKWQLNGVSDNMPGNQDLNRPHHFGFDEYCLWQIHRQGERYANPLIYQNGKKLDNLDDSYGPDVFNKFITDFIERKRDKPFFVYYPMVLPHSPFVATPDSPEWEDRANRSKQDNAFFKDMVEYLDKGVGKIIDKLKETGEWENTLVIFVADNGTNKRIVSKTNSGDVAGGKGSTINTGNHVPFITVWPSIIRSGGIYDGIISFADFLPTLADVAGADTSGLNPDGKSFFSVLKGKDEIVQSEIFIHYTPRFGKAEHNRWVTDGKYKLYKDSRFYNTENDLSEKNKLTNLNPNEKKIKTKFEKIIQKNEKKFPFEWNDKIYNPQN